MATPIAGTEASRESTAGSIHVTGRGSSSTAMRSPPRSTSIRTVRPAAARSRSSSVSGSPAGAPATARIRSPGRRPAAAAGDPSCTALIGPAVIIRPVVRRGCGSRTTSSCSAAAFSPAALRLTVSDTGRSATGESAAISSAYDDTGWPATAVTVSPARSAGRALPADPGSPSLPYRTTVSEFGPPIPSVGLPRSMSGFRVTVRLDPSAGRRTVSVTPRSTLPTVTAWIRSSKIGSCLSPTAVISSPVRRPARQAAPPGRVPDSVAICSRTPRP